MGVVLVVPCGTVAYTPFRSPGFEVWSGWGCLGGLVSCIQASAICWPEAGIGRESTGGGLVAAAKASHRHKKLHPRFFQKHQGSRGGAGFEKDDLVVFGKARGEPGSFRRQSTA